MPIDPKPENRARKRRHSASSSAERSRRTPRKEAHTKRAPRRAADVRRARHLALIALYVVLVVELGAALLTSPALAVKQIRIRGLAALTAQEAGAVTLAASLPPRTNWLRAPLGKQEEHLQGFPWIRTAIASRRFPNAVEIDVSTRTPVIQAILEGERWEVDEDCFALRPVRAGLAGRLPVVALAHCAPVTEGAPITDQALRSAISIYRFCSFLPAPHIAKIEVDQNDNLCLNMEGGITVQFGQPEDIPSKLETMKRIYARDANIARKLSSINLTCPTAPACIPRVVATPDTKTLGRSNLNPISASITP